MLEVFVLSMHDANSVAHSNNEFIYYFIIVPIVIYVEWYEYEYYNKGIMAQHV